MDFNPKYFNPLTSGGFEAAEGAIGFSRGPEPDDTYIYSPKVILAVNVAMATNRPLLVAGEPGSGKTSLALNVASILRRIYYERVITSRTQATDLLWRFDALRRLSDATAGTNVRELPPISNYVEPGPVWWAFDPSGAAESLGSGRLNDPGRSSGDRAGKDAVLLLDEIDKADPDVPNDLLEPFGNKTFTVQETGEKVLATRSVLLILTTNRERELPQAFLRRCVVLELEPPTGEWFVEVAQRKLGSETGDLYKLVADRIMELRKAAELGGHRLPGTGEFLDAIQAWRQLKIEGNSKPFKYITLAAAWKQPKAPPEQASS